MGAARLLSAAWNCTARICGVRTRDGTQITGKSGDHRYRAARWQNPRPSRARLGYTTWHSPPDHLDHAPLHPGELCGLPSAGRRDDRDPGWHHDEGPVQCRGRDRGAWVYSAKSVKVRHQPVAPGWGEEHAMLGELKPL